MDPQTVQEANDGQGDDPEGVHGIGRGVSDLVGIVSKARRGAELLRRADVVLYDALVNSRFAPLCATVRRIPLRAAKT